MLGKPATHRLRTEEATIAPGERAALSTPRTPVSFQIASMAAPDTPLLFVALRRDGARQSWPRRALRWLSGNVGNSTIYEAVEPEEFDDFMLSLIAPPNDANDCVEAGETTFEGVQIAVGKSAKLPTVNAGDRLLLDVFNPTDKPIKVAVTFSGPEIR